MVCACAASGGRESGNAKPASHNHGHTGTSLRASARSECRTPTSSQPERERELTLKPSVPPLPARFFGGALLSGGTGCNLCMEFERSRTSRAGLVSLARGNAQRPEEGPGKAYGRRFSRAFCLTYGGGRAKIEMPASVRPLVTSLIRIGLSEPRVVSATRGSTSFQAALFSSSTAVTIPSSCCPATTEPNLPRPRFVILPSPSAFERAARIEGSFASSRAFMPSAFHSLVESESIV